MTKVSPGESSPKAHPAQGGVTLGPERGELGDGRSNEQITQQAERPTPPTTVRIGWTVLYLPRVEVPCSFGE